MKLKLIIIVSIITFFSVNISYAQQNNTTDSVLPDIQMLEKIGEKDFEPTPIEKSEGSYSIRIIEDYIAYLYPYVVALVASLALLMVVVGSLEITMAGGDSGKVSEGKDRIMYAIFGLLLLLLSSLILWTVNPTFFTYG